MIKPKNSGMDPITGPPATISPTRTTPGQIAATLGWRQSGSIALVRMAAYARETDARVTTRLPSPAFIAIRGGSWNFTRFRNFTKSRTRLRPRISVHSDEMQMNTEEPSDTAIARLPRLGSRVRIPSPAPIARTAKKAAEDRDFA